MEPLLRVGDDGVLEPPLPAFRRSDGATIKRFTIDELKLDFVAVDRVGILTWTFMMFVHKIV